MITELEMFVSVYPRSSICCEYSNKSLQSLNYEIKLEYPYGMHYHRNPPVTAIYELILYIRDCITNQTKH